MFGETVSFVFERSTKGAHVFKETDDHGVVIDDMRDCKIGTIYLRKSAFGEAAPRSILVSVQAES